MILIGLVMSADWSLSLFDPRPKLSKRLLGGFMTTRTLIVSPSIIFQQITVPGPTYLVGVQVRTSHVIGAANMNTPMWPPSLVVHKTFFHLKFTVMLSTKRLSDWTRVFSGLAAYY
jgi:hypothetical protein